MINPSDLIEPYDVTLKNMSASQRKEWADQVFAEIKPLLKPTDTIVMLAGVIYRENLVNKIEELGCNVKIPMEGLRIGEQNQWLKGQLVKL